MSLKLSVVVVAYQRPLLLRALVASWQAQTFTDWDMLVIHDGSLGLGVFGSVIEEANQWKVSGFPEIVGLVEPERQGAFGHPLRELGIRRAEGDWLLITNDDNYYAPVFADRMMARTAPDVACVMCNMVHNHPRRDYLGRDGAEGEYGVLVTRPEVQFADIGCFIVPTEVAKKVGFPWRDHDGDGHYLQACIAAAAAVGRSRVLKIPQVLFVHN